MKRAKFFTAICIFSVLSIMILSGGAVAEIGKLADFQIIPEHAVPEGTNITLVASIETDLGFTATGEAIIAFVLPKNYNVLDVTLAIYPSRPDYTNHAVKVEEGPWVDVVATTRLKLLSTPTYGSDLADLESQGYEWWVGATQVDTLPELSTIGVIATLESGGVGAYTAVICWGLSGTRLDPTEPITGTTYVGVSQVNLVSTLSDSVVSTAPVGISTGLTGGLSVSGKTGRIFVPSAGNFSYDGEVSGQLVGTHRISVLNSDGSYREDIYLPHTVGEGARKDNETIDFAAWAPNLGTGGGGRVYAGVTSPGFIFVSPYYHSIRIMNEDGSTTGVTTTRLDLPNNILIGGGLLGTIQQPFAVTWEGTASNTVYVTSRNDGAVYKITDHSTGAAYTRIPLPHDVSSNAVLLLGGGSNYLAVAAENHLIILDSSDVVQEDVTLEADNTGMSNLQIINDPQNNRLYVGTIASDQRFRIYRVNYGVSPATLEAIADMGQPIGVFSLAKIGGDVRLYVPCLPTSPGGPCVVKVVEADVTPMVVGTAFTQLGSFFITSGFANGKLYVGDLGGMYLDLAQILLGPPEVYKHEVLVFNPSGSNNMNLSLSRRIDDVVNGPVVFGPSGNDLIITSFPIGGALYLMGADEAHEFTFVTPPVVENVRVNGGLVKDGDYISSDDPLLTADLRDNSGVITCEVWLNGTLLTNLQFDPGMPANTKHNPVSLSVNLGQLSETATHSITIEVSDGGGAGTFEVFDLTASPGGAVTMRGDYPVVYPQPYRPVTGSTPEDRILRIAYELTEDANITIAIVDFTGHPVFTRKCHSATNGGRAGYNEVSWDGRLDTTGGLIGNGIYPYKIIAGGNKIIGQGWVVVFDE